jgi:hypothetical protein
MTQDIELVSSIVDSCQRPTAQRSPSMAKMTNDFTQRGRAQADSSSPSRTDDSPSPAKSFSAPNKSRPSSTSSQLGRRSIADQASDESQLQVKARARDGLSRPPRVPATSGLTGQFSHQSSRARTTQNARNHAGFRPLDRAHSSWRIERVLNRLGVEWASGPPCASLTAARDGRIAGRDEEVDLPEQPCADTDTHAPVSEALLKALLRDLRAVPGERCPVRPFVGDEGLAVRIAKHDRDESAALHAAQREPRVHAAGGRWGIPPAPAPPASCLSALQQAIQRA